MSARTAKKRSHARNWQIEPLDEPAHRLVGRLPNRTFGVFACGTHHGLMSHIREAIGDRLS